MRLPRIVVAGLAGILLVAGPALAQNDAQKVGNGDWYFEEDADPFDDTKMTILFLPVEDESQRLGILGVGFRCDKNGLYLAVMHSYMGGSDNETIVTYRLGSAEPETTDARLGSDNTASFVEINPTDVAPLRADPRIAIRLIDPLDEEVNQESWDNIAGTAEALDMLHCL